MGNSESSDQSKINDFLSNYTLEQKFSSDRYGDLTLYRETQNGKKRICIISKIFVEEKEFLQDRKKIDKLSALNHESVLKLLFTQNTFKNELCSSYHKIEMAYEFLKKTLKQDIEQRVIQRGMYLEENELWLILLSVLAGLCYLRDKDITYLDIKPKNILINYDERYKILPHLPFSELQNSYSQALFYLHAKEDDDFDFYLSPAQIENLQSLQTSPVHDGSKTDIFTLGISIIESALLTPIIQDLYDFNGKIKNIHINEDILNQAIDKVGNRYSTSLVNFIKRLVIIKEEDRPDVYELYTFITQMYYNQQIADTKPEIQQQQIKQQESFSPLQTQFTTPFQYGTPVNKEQKKESTIVVEQKSKSGTPVNQYTKKQTINVEQLKLAPTPKQENKNVQLVKLSPRPVNQKQKKELNVVADMKSNDANYLISMTQQFQQKNKPVEEIKLI